MRAGHWIIGLSHMVINSKVDSAKWGSQTPGWGDSRRTEERNQIGDISTDLILSVKSREHWSCS